jgi:hypothetical protein
MVNERNTPEYRGRNDFRHGTFRWSTDAQTNELRNEEGNMKYSKEVPAIVPYILQRPKTVI